MELACLSSVKKRDEKGHTWLAYESLVWQDISNQDQGRHAEDQTMITLIRYFLSYMKLWWLHRATWGSEFAQYAGSSVAKGLLLYLTKAGLLKDIVSFSSIVVITPESKYPRKSLPL